MYTVLIAGTDKQFIDQLGDNVNKELGYEIVATAYDGKSSIEKIKSLRPGILILDIIMPESDGIYIVDYIRCQMNDYHPVIYILSGIFSNKIMKVLSRLEVDFVSMKPVTSDVVIHNLSSILDGIEQPTANIEDFRTEKADAPDIIVRQLSMDLGIMPRHMSTRCMMEALIFTLNHPSMVQPLTKCLYPEVAKRMDITSVAVERNIRNAVAGIQKANTPLFSKIFYYAQNKRITNGEFLDVVIQYLSRHTQAHSVV